jgi:hypothetical protein
MGYVVESFAAALGFGAQESANQPESAQGGSGGGDAAAPFVSSDASSFGDAGGGASAARRSASFGEHRDAVRDLVSGKHNGRFSLSLGGRPVLPLEVCAQLLLSDGEIEAVRARFGAACRAEHKRAAQQEAARARHTRSREALRAPAGQEHKEDGADGEPEKEEAALGQLGFKLLVRQLTKLASNGSDLPPPSAADVDTAFTLADTVQRLCVCVREVMGGVGAEI